MLLGERDDEWGAGRMLTGTSMRDGSGESVDFLTQVRRKYGHQ
ncbi:hypothetical protein ABZ379_06260 [Streptomyces canus]